jgi:hypothetical protein
MRGVFLYALAYFVFEVVGVDLDIVLPLFRDLAFRKDGVHRAYRHAAVAVNALSRIDVQHLVIIGAMDAVHWANIDAGFVLDPNARLSDYVGHRF